MAPFHDKKFITEVLTEGCVDKAQIILDLKEGIKFTRAQDKRLKDQSKVANKKQKKEWSLCPRQLYI